MSEGGSMMTVMPRLPDTPAVRAAERLRNALARQGIDSDVHGGYGLALVEGLRSFRTVESAAANYATD